MFLIYYFRHKKIENKIIKFHLKASLRPKICVENLKNMWWQIFAEIWGFLKFKYKCKILIWPRGAWGLGSGGDGAAPSNFFQPNFSSAISIFTKISSLSKFQCLKSIWAWFFLTLSFDFTEIFTDFAEIFTDFVDSPSATIVLSNNSWPWWRGTFGRLRWIWSANFWTRRQRR